MKHLHFNVNIIFIQISLVFLEAVTVQKSMLTVLSGLAIVSAIVHPDTL